MTGDTAVRFHRAVFATDLARGLDPAAGPEGRFHHDGQAALYLSETVEGVVVALATYRRPQDPPRVILPLDVSAGTLLDLRDAGVAESLGAAPGAASERWQETRRLGRHPASWALSDAARATGADGMLYASRKRPDLTPILCCFAGTCPAPRGSHRRARRSRSRADPLPPPAVPRHARPAGRLGLGFCRAI